MAKKFKEKTNWTFGLELELNCKVRLPGSFEFLSILDNQNQDVIVVSGDMGNDYERTVEIVTMPLYIGDEDKHHNNMILVGILKELFEEIRQMDDSTITKEAMKSRFDEMLKSKNLIGKYSIKIWKEKVKITSFNPVTVSGEQISFGVPIKEVHDFLKDMDTPWYGKGEFEKGEDNWKINYALCIMKYLSSLYLQNMDITSPQAKNLWKVMPRNPIKEVLGEKFDKLFATKEWQNLQKKFTEDFAQTKAGQDFKEEFKREYEHFCVDLLTNGAVGGKVTSIKKIPEQLVFECRSIPADLREFYFEY